MARKMFLNLPVKDLPRTVDFFTKLGFAFDPRFTNESGAGMIVSDDIFIMLLAEDFFRTFTTKAICDTTSHIEAIACISLDSRAEVDGIVAKALAAGAAAPRPPQDHGFMYEHGFEDLDGHKWEFVYMQGDPPA